MKKTTGYAMFSDGELLFVSTDLDTLGRAFAAHVKGEINGDELTLGITSIETVTLWGVEE